LKQFTIRVKCSVAIKIEYDTAKVDCDRKNIKKKNFLKNVEIFVKFIKKIDTIFKALV